MIPLGIAVLGTPSLDLGPILVWVCGATDGTFGPVISDVPGGWSRRVRANLDGHVGEEADEKSEEFLGCRQ